MAAEERGVTIAQDPVNRIEKASRGISQVHHAYEMGSSNSSIGLATKLRRMKRRLLLEAVGLDYDEAIFRSEFSSSSTRSRPQPCQ